MFFSIITVCYNAEKTIEKTIKSVLCQSHTDFEIIVKDGVSIDHTLEQIPDDDRIRIISKRDSGIYNAMNQAIDLAKGKYLIFMNCGDTFTNEDTLKIIEEHVMNNPGDILYGNYIVDAILRYQPDNLTDFYLYRTPLCHQSMIISKESFEKIGKYDCKYKILADYDFTLKAWKNEKNFVHIDVPVCTYLGGGVSETKNGMEIKEKERREILKKYYSAKERWKYNIILTFSLRKFRIWLMSGNAPVWVESLYRKIANKVNS